MICHHQQKRTFGGWRTSSRDFTFIVEAVKPVCTHDGVAEPNHSHLNGGINVSSAIPPSIRLFEELPSLLVNSRKWYQQILQKVQNLVPHDYIKSCSRYCIYCCRAVCCVYFLPIHSGHQVRWTYQPGSHRRKVTQDFSSTFFLRCVP